VCFLSNHRNINKGERAAINLEKEKLDGICYIYVFPNNIAVLVIADLEYPQRIAHEIILEVYREFVKLYDLMKIETYKTD